MNAKKTLLLAGPLLPLAALVGLLVYLAAAGYTVRVTMPPAVDKALAALTTAPKRAEAAPPSPRGPGTAPAPVAPPPPTQTPPPTPATPAPPTPKASPLVIVPTWTCARDTIGYTEVKGSVFNGGADAARFVRVRATVTVGGLTNDGWSYADAQTIAPGGAATFTVYVKDPAPALAGGQCHVGILDHA